MIISFDKTFHKKVLEFDFKIPIPDTNKSANFKSHINGRFTTTDSIKKEFQRQMINGGITIINQLKNKK